MYGVLKFNAENYLFILEIMHNIINNSTDLQVSLTVGVAA